MRKLTLSQIVGMKFENARCWAIVTRFDPISETFIFDGYDKDLKDPCVWLRHDLMEFDVEVAPTDEERKMIEDAKLTNQVRLKSEELQKVITAWLNSGNVGR